jgi:SNF2 family DNA or RNA helicase
MAELYPFQREGALWLADGAPTKYLADDCGMGKSVQDITAADLLGVDHVQVECPAIAVEDWYRKFLSWSDYGRHVFKSFAGAPIAPAQVPRKSVIINSFECSVRHRALYKQNKHRGLLIVDEAHYAKNPRTNRALALYGGNCEGFGGISQNYDLVWCNSGTPTPNGDPRELWPHLRALRPYSIIDSGTGLPMSYTAFGDRFCRFRPGLGGDKVVGTRNEEELTAILGGGPRPFMLRRLGDVAGLPDVRFELYPMLPASVPRELDPAQWPDLTGRLDYILAAAGEGDLDAQYEEQIATLRRLTGLLKVEATVNILGEELKNKTLENVVVFGYSIDVVNEIARRLSKFGAAAITGATSSKHRWEYIDQFNAGNRRVLVGQILACMTNISLRDCRNAFFAETDWVGENNYQAAYRCRRIDGHRDSVLARVLCISGTIDEPIQASTRRKIRQSRLILPTS